MSELDNSDREIREGALEAAIQFSDRSVIPRLREAADRTSDATEKEAILAAIDYLNLPSLTEYLEQAQTLGLTNGIATSTNASGHSHHGPDDAAH